jgi:hypothetical protein
VSDELRLITAIIVLCLVISVNSMWLVGESVGHVRGASGRMSGRDMAEGEQLAEDNPPHHVIALQNSNA